MTPQCSLTMMTCFPHMTTGQYINKGSSFIKLKFNSCLLRIFNKMIFNDTHFIIQRVLMIQNGKLQKKKDLLIMIKITMVN